MDDSGCPVCGGMKRDPRTIVVCGACAKGVERTGVISVTRTSELPAISTIEEAALGPSSTGLRRAITDEGYGCAWCGKPGAEVKRLLAGNGGVSICNECVSLCARILQAEHGDDWQT